VRFKQKGWQKHLASLICFKGEPTLLTPLINFKVSATTTINPNATSISAPGASAHATRIAALLDQALVAANPFTAPMAAHVAGFTIDCLRLPIIAPTPLRQCI